MTPFLGGELSDNPSFEGKEKEEERRKKTSCPMTPFLGGELSDNPSYLKRVERGLTWSQRPDLTWQSPN